MAQNLGIRTAPVERGTLAQEARATGSVMANESRIQVVQSRAAGWVERLQVRKVGDPVRKGQLLAEVYSPDLLAAQQELLLALRSAGEHPGAGSLVEASRYRLSFLGMSDTQIAQIEQNGHAQRRVAFYSPINGVVTQLGVREGAQVSPGMNLFNLVDLSTVWVTAEITEVQAAWIANGQPAELRFPALPGRVFKGSVDYVYPELMAETRTLKARIVLDNPRLELKPEMYATVTVSRGTKHDALLIPSEALIRTGTRSAVIIAEGEGHFRPADVTVGDEADGKVEIRSGLQEHQQVVASGQFLIDSEANLRGALGRLTPPENEPPPGAMSGKGSGEGQPTPSMKGMEGMQMKKEPSAGDDKTTPEKRR
jgi:Cu(I)/Ag(I) efflux system membrane fusion protein